MQIVERGAGPALVLIPGLQGRWEYVRPAVEALSSAFRVMTFPLCDERSSGFAFDEGRGFDCYVEQVRAVLDHGGIDRAIVCGISFGGLIALRFAAAHPDRTCALILASTPGPGWHLRRRHEVYARLPFLLGPLFLAETPWRLRRELATAFPERSTRLRFAGLQLRTLVRAPLSLARMACRARMITTIDAAADCARINAPTLIVTGERALDHVVSVDDSVGYVSSIRGARGVVLERTGHLGSITRPADFAALVREFADAIGVGRVLSDPPQRRVQKGPGLLSRSRLMPLREIAGPAGRLECLLDEPQPVRTIDANGLVHAGQPGGVRAAVVLGHPHTEHGGTMHTKVVYQTAKALSRIGCAVLRINFRGAGASAGAFTGGPGEKDDFETAIDFMHERYPGARLWAAGMSFGAWIGLSVGAEDPRVSTLIGIALPIGVPGGAAALGAPNTDYDWEAVRTSPKPKFFIHGERDEVCPLKAMREFYARAAEPKELVVIDGADHLFDGKVSEVADAIEDLLGDWSR